jgi:hypothetical protein
MRQEGNPRYWVAVRVWRGFPVEAKAFRKKIDANKQGRNNWNYPLRLKEAVVAE